MLVVDLVERLSWPELQRWIAFYTWEADQALPPNKRPIRPRNAAQAAAALDKAFGIRRPTSKE